MKLNKYLIANGNSTLLVKGYKSSEKKEIIKKYLGSVEQIGFVSYPKGVPKLSMMGDELCINGIIAFASTLPNKSGVLLTSGYQGLIPYKKQCKYTTIQLDFPYQQINNIILLNGIGFIFLKNNKQISKNYLSKYCSKYNFPAFGAILYQKNKITPYVYVKQTNSLFRETACGSASIVLNILTGDKTIIQPTGEIIQISKFGNRFTIKAKVVKIGESYE